MTSLGYALARAGLIRALTAYSGITTADGAFDGTATLVDSNLKGRNDFISEKTILIMSGDAKDEDKGATAFDTSDGKITLQGTGFSHQIKAGTIFRVLNISTVEIDVANMDAKIGTNTDPAGTTTLFAWMARLFAVGGQGLVYYGKVTQIDDATHFRVAGLTGFGDAYFANNYRVYVVRDAAGGGAAPQGEMQPCSAYDSTDGIFTYTAFTAPLAVDDEVLLLHERIAEIKDLIDRLGAFTGTENLKAILGNLTTTKNLGGILGALTTTDNLKAILGAYTAAAPLEAAIDVIIAYVDELETRLTAARAGYLDNINNADLANLIRQVAEAADTFSFDETSALEQDMVTVTITARANIGGIWLDMVNVTQDTTIKLYHKVDGTNFREVSSSAWATTDSDGVLVEGFTAYRDIKVTLTCGGGGAASVNVPYAIV